MAQDPRSDGDRGLIQRRALMAGGVALAAGGRGARAQAIRPLVVFLGEQSSAECQSWRSQWEPLFVASAAYKKLDYRVVYPADSSLLLKQESWPPHLRWVLDTFLASEDGVQRGKASPRFFLAQNRQISFTATGIAGWRDAMWPMILSVTGTSA